MVFLYFSLWYLTNFLKAVQNRLFIMDISRLVFNHKSVDYESLVVFRNMNLVLYKMLSAIWYHLHNLKKHEKHQWRSVTFSKAVG